MVLLPDALLVQIDDLPEGETLRTVCPACEATHEKSFRVVKLSTGFKAHCFRGKCGYFVGRDKGGYQPEPSSKNPKLSAYKATEVPLSDKLLNTLLGRYRLTHSEVVGNLVRGNVAGRGIIMPIFDREGVSVGQVIKYFKRAQNAPKSVCYWLKDRPALHYPRQSVYGGPVALVEDTLSSIKVARHCRTRALLGTHLSDNAITQLKKETDDIILALDNDMIPKMVSYAKRLRGLFNSVSIIVWPKDPKDLPDSRISTLLTEYLL